MNFGLSRRVFVDAPVSVINVITKKNGPVKSRSITTVSQLKKENRADLHHDFDYEAYILRNFRAQQRAA
jgi:hypothetical protein